MNMGYRINRLKYLVLGIIFFVLGIGEGMAQASFASDANYSTAYYKSMYFSSNLQSGQYFKLSVTIESMGDIELTFFEKKCRKVKFKIHATFYSDKGCQKPALQKEKKKITIHRRLNAGFGTDDIIIAPGSYSGSIDVDYTVIDGGKTRFFGLTQSFVSENPSVDLKLDYFFNPCSGLVTPSIIGETNLCAGEKTTLSVASTVDGATYQWYKNGVLQNETGHTLSGVSSGSFTVTVTNASGCSATSAITEVTVDELPESKITASGSLKFCKGGSVTLTASTGTSYLWSTGSTSQSINVSASGSFTVTVTNALGCSATSAITKVTVDDLPESKITASGPLKFCKGGSVTLTASAGTSYLWSTGSTSQSINVSASGSFTVTVTNALGCSATSAITKVTVDDLPESKITASGRLKFCKGGSVTLTASTGTSYLWSTGSTSQSINVSASGSFTVTVTNALGCSATSAITKVTVESLPTATISTPANKTSFCAGESIVLTASGGDDGATYNWAKKVLYSDNSWTSLSEMTKNLQVTETGTYRVTVSNNNNCSATSAATVVTIHALPSSSIQHVGSELRLFNASGKHQWYLDGRKIEGATSYSHVPTQVGKYRVQTTNEHGCSVMSEPYEFKMTRVRRSLDGEFMIYPNPNKGHFWIKKPSEVEIAELRVYDMLGREYHRVKTKQTEVNIPGLAGGMYFLEIITKPQEGYAPSRTKKFIVK